MVVTGQNRDLLGGEHLLIMRMAYGFRDTDALIAMALLSLGGYRPQLPGRA